MPALWLILGAFVFDELDGRIARLIGKKVHSASVRLASDIISFGAAPAFLMQRVILHEFERLGLVVPRCMLCGASFSPLQLPRLDAQLRWQQRIPRLSNTRLGGTGRVIDDLFIWLEGKEMTDTVWRWVPLSVLVFLAVMMVSEVKYPTFKTLDFRARQPFTKFVVFVTGIACLVVLWEYIVPVVLPIIFTAYLVYGFIRPKLSRKLRRKLKRKNSTKFRPGGSVDDPRSICHGHRCGGTDRLHLRRAGRAGKRRDHGGRSTAAASVRSSCHPGH